MFKTCLLSFIFVVGINQASAVEITWDDPELGTGLHVCHQGKGWVAHELQKDNIKLYHDLFGNPEVTKYMQSGKTIPEDERKTRFEVSLKKCSDGIPSGPLILEQENKSVGFVCVTPYTKPGVGEFVFALLPEAQGKGIGKSALGFIVDDWAPAIRKRGLGLDIEKSHPTIKKFSCYGGEPLSLIYATARPSNQASWKCIKPFNFYPSEPTDKTHQISCESWEDSQHGSLEEYVIKAYFSETSSNRLKINEFYPMLDETGTLRTLSFVEDYESVRYHFERKVE